MIKVRKKTYLQPAKVGEALNHTVWITIKIQGIMVSFFLFFLDQKNKNPKKHKKKSLSSSTHDNCTTRQTQHFT